MVRRGAAQILDNVDTTDHAPSATPFYAQPG